MEQSKICTHLLIPVIAILLSFKYADYQKLQSTPQTNKEISSCENKSRNNEIVIRKTSRQIFNDLLNENREHRKERVRNAAKYYNPITLIYRVFDI